MFKRSSMLIAAWLLWPAMASAATCESWQSTVLPADRPALTTPVQQVLDQLPARPRSVSPDYLADQAAALDEARYLLQRALHPLPLGDIHGAWRVRSIQAGRTGAYAYPYFAGRIDRTACGFRFSKTRGSQRRSGALLPMAEDDRALAFLGAFTVNDDPTRPYGPDNRPLGEPAGPEGPVNSVGRLLRIGPHTLLMLLDVGDNGFELYRLER